MLQTLKNVDRHKICGCLTVPLFGDNLEYRNKILFAILNLHVAPMPPIKFWFNPTPFQSRCGFKDIQDGSHGNSESLCRSDASAQSNLLFGRRYHFLRILDISKCYYIYIYI